jgi:PAT family beta-lactamase induction signal transducer AmpG
MSIYPVHPADQQRHPPVYTLGLLLSLYLAQGFPAGFMTQALPAILRQYNVSLGLIGLSGMLLLPWAFKFLWAPVVDGYYSPRVGQSRSWILPTQLGAAALVATLALFDPVRLVEPAVLLPFFGLLLAINLLGATQDVASDGLAVRMLDRSFRHWGNAVQVVGYRTGLIVGGGGLLLMLGTLGWPLVFVCMTGLILLNTLPVWRFKEPVWPHVQATAITQHRPSLWSRFYTQFGYFWHSPQMRAWLGVLLVFKIADGLSSSMVKPMMVDMGYTLEQIGLLASILGSAASLLGAVLAAWLMRYMSRFAALLSFNAFQAVCTGLYAWAAWHFAQQGVASTWLVYGANAIEHLAASMALVALLTTAMDYARPERAGSDFTFQVCMMTLFGGTGHLVSGYMAESLGYTTHFMISAVVGVLLLMPIWLWKRQSCH